MRFDEIVHAARIGGEHGAIGRRQCARNAASAMRRMRRRARFAIRFQRGGAENFGQLAGRQPPQRVHLPQADPAR